MPDIKPATMFSSGVSSRLLLPACNPGISPEDPLSDAFNPHQAANPGGTASQHLTVDAMKETRM